VVAKPTGRRFPAHVLDYLKNAVIQADEHLDTARRRIDARFGWARPKHIEAYRGWADGKTVEFTGRVLASKPMGGPKDDDDWWDNLLNTYRRFESDEVPGVALKAQFRGAQATATSDAEGYYRFAFDTAAVPLDELWDNAAVSLADGTLLTPQPILQVGPKAAYGCISDIDDTILHSSILDWKTAAQLTFLHNARTRKPLQGVAKLYQALQAGADGQARNPIFYVSSSPWNLYDLLEDFLELNAIPFGPIHLRDLGFDPGKFVKSAGHGHKLERAREIILRFPQLRWVLLGDSGQADAELYAEAAREFGDRILAIYIRDVDPDTDDPRDTFVDTYIEKVAGTHVPMLRVSDSLAIAEHALTLGLIAESSMDAIDAEVKRDRMRPTLGEAAAESAKESIVEGAEAATQKIAEQVAEATDKVAGKVEAAKDAVVDTARKAAGRRPPAA
jgi:phosphatidate phosphatase APP1